MFCPSCGKSNSLDQKFCAACGINLHAVAQALTRREDDFFSKMDAGMDSLLARYNEHVFKKAGAPGRESVARSWTILGQSVVTALIDLLLFTLMSTLLPIRLMLLVVSTPFRLLAERSEGESDDEIVSDDERYMPARSARGRLGGWREDSAPSVVEHTTALFDTGKIRRK